MAEQQNTKCCGCFRRKEPVIPPPAEPQPRRPDNSDTKPKEPIIEQPKPGRPNIVPSSTGDQAANQLGVVNVELHQEENREAHKTAEYEIEQLIVRRGQAFDITVTFNRDYDPERDFITVQFSTGKNPQQNKGGIVRLQIQDTLIPSKWGMQIKEANGNTVRLSIMSSAQAAIGYYDFIVETKSKDSSGKESLQQYKLKKQICILFNAWCKDDVVFMEDDEDRNEYVLNESGNMWRGSEKRLTVLPWNFGQFDDVALKSALWLLDEWGLKNLQMSNVVVVVRTMTSMANSSDKGGVLQGNWSGEYPDGKNPGHWSGSVEILQQFWETKNVVKYGQCWVFSGLLTTLLRTLGVPTRSVTNYNSAHDTEKSLTIDYYFNADGKAEEHLNDDSVWNYHVWNECWFKRLDLPDGHDGWQAVDATPQEASGGFYQCGPASVNAIRNGEVYLNFDTDFIFAEVNADRCYWQVKPTEGDGAGFFSAKPDCELVTIDKHSTGKCISTRMPGALTERNDVTNCYKYQEGSDEERRVVEFVNKYSTKAHLEIYEGAVEDVECKLDSPDEVKIGGMFKATATLKNKSSEQRTVVGGHFTAIVEFYTGRAAGTLKDEKKDDLVLKQGEEKKFTFEISSELSGKISPEANIKVYLRASVKETGQRFAKQDIVEFMKPELEVKFSSDEIELGKEVTVTAFLTNPLPWKLTNGKFHFEFNRMDPKTMDIACKGPVRANEKTEVTAAFLAVKRPGFRGVSVNFNSDQITGVSRGGAITVSDSTNSGNTGFYSFGQE